MSEIPIREMIQNSVNALGGKANYSQIIKWVTENYGEKNPGTIRSQTIACSVNQPSRVHYPENSKPRESDSRYDLFYSIGRGEVELFSKQKHGNWGITLHDGKPQITHEKKLVKNSFTDEFFFIEKDFQSTTTKKVDSQYLHHRFKTLHDILKRNLGESFDDSQSRVGHPFNQGSKEWRDFQWLTFARKGTFFGSEQDSIQFQVSIHKNDDLSVMIWLDGLAKQTRKITLNKIRDNADKFRELLQNLPSSYYIGAQTTDEDNDEILVSNYDESFREKIIERISKSKQKLYIVRYVSKQDAIDFNTEIITEISDTFEKLIPLASFLGKTFPNGADKAHSCFILTHYSDSKYDDIEGEQYQYDNNKPNSRRLIEGSKFIIQSKINNENYFVGCGKIGTIESSPGISDSGKPITKFIAKFSEYQKFNPPKIRTSDLYNEMKSQEAYGSQPPSLLPISRKLYSKIIGEDLTESDQAYDAMNLEPFLRALEWKPNLILYGPPGTGKTFHANEIAKKIAGTRPKIKERTWKSLTTLVLLENNGSPLNYHEIAKRALSKNLIKTQGKTPHETIAKDMRNDLDTRESNSIFVKPEDGVYGLRLPTTFENAAEMILLAENKPMHYDKITEIALEKNMINQKEKAGITPTRSMNQILSQDVKNNDSNSKFIKIQPATYALRNQISSDNDSLIFKATFHPSYAYEDFVEGYRPNTDTHSKSQYALKKGIFWIACEAARENTDSNVVLIIDEINRGNIPKIFGELITLIEDDKRKKKYALNLVYSQELFFVPGNLRIIGTMNTADKSLIQMDDALKRRFVFEELMPDTESLLAYLNNQRVPNAAEYKKILDTINDRILGKGTENAEQKMKQFRDRQIGHSYFWKIKNDQDLQSVIQFDVIPLLQDYFYGDFNEIRQILGHEIISENNQTTDLVTNPAKAADLRSELLKI